MLCKSKDNATNRQLHKHTRKVTSTNTGKTTHKNTRQPPQVQTTTNSNTGKITNCNVNMKSLTKTQAETNWVTKWNSSKLTNRYRQWHKHQERHCQYNSMMPYPRRHSNHISRPIFLKYHMTVKGALYMSFKKPSKYHNFDSYCFMNSFYSALFFGWL